MFFPFSGKFCVFPCTTPIMANVGDNIIGLGKHPTISPIEGVFGMYQLNALRQHKIGGCVFVRIWFWHPGKNNAVADVRKFPGKLFENSMNLVIKSSAVTNVKHVHMMIGNQLLQYGSYAGL